MVRYPLAFLTLAVATATAGAQFRTLPLAPGVHQGSSIGPGTQYIPQPTPRFDHGYSWGSPNATRPINGYSFFPSPYYYGYGLNYGYSYIEPPYYYEPVRPVVVGVPSVPQPPEPTIVLANEFPATLIVQFPAAADVWLNGKEVKGEAAEERTLTSPVLMPGASFAFEVKGRWTHGGKTYEANRTVKLGGGDRSRLIVVSGTEVK